MPEIIGAYGHTPLRQQSSIYTGIGINATKTRFSLFPLLGPLHTVKSHSEALYANCWADHQTLDAGDMGGWARPLCWVWVWVVPHSATPAYHPYCGQLSTQSRQRNSSAVSLRPCAGVASGGQTRG